MREEKERLDELQEDVIFTETLKLPVKPACFFAVALPFAKAEKLVPEHCAEILFNKEAMRNHHREMTMTT